jgi:hypothetical protein
MFFQAQSGKYFFICIHNHIHDVPKHPWLSVTQDPSHEVNQTLAKTPILVEGPNHHQSGTSSSSAITCLVDTAAEPRKLLHGEDPDHLK